MIDCYLERGTLYVLDDGGIKAERVVTDEGNGVLETKNIAVYPEFHGRDYVKAPPEYPARTYRSAYSVLHHSVKYFFTVITAARSTIAENNWSTWSVCKGNCESNIKEGTRR